MFALAAAALAANRTVAVVIAPSFYLIDAMGPLDVFRAVQLKAYAGVNLTTHEWHGDVPGGIVANGSLRVDLLAESAAPVRASDGTVVTPDGTLAAAATAIAGRDRIVGLMVVLFDQFSALTIAACACNREQTSNKRAKI